LHHPNRSDRSSLKCAWGEIETNFQLVENKYENVELHWFGLDSLQMILTFSHTLLVNIFFQVTGIHNRDDIIEMHDVCTGFSTEWNLIICDISFLASFRTVTALVFSLICPSIDTSIKLVLSSFPFVATTT